MKRLSLLICFIFYYLFLHAENEYAITTANLNLREHNSKSSTSLITLDAGDTLEILSKDENWAKVRVNNLEGYVSTFYISPIDSNLEDLEENSTSESGPNWYLIIGVLLVICAIGLLWWMISHKCSGCGKLGTVRQVHSVLIDTKPTQIKEVLKRYNSKGEVTSKREVLVDATKKIYRDFHKCSKCGYETTSISTRTVKN